MSILNQLNEYQQAAAAKVEGALLILAGAGSGKTRTVTYRIAHMILEKGISPYRILAVTFTNKAAKEMRERVEKLVGDDAHKATVSTFHSFAMRLLRIYSDKIGYDSNFTIYDGDDQKRIIKNISKDLVIQDKKLTEAIIASLISKLKENSVSPEEYEQEHRFQPNTKIIAEIYRRYNSQLKANNCMDFADILVNCYKLLMIDEIAEKISDKYRYIMVDEYQDTNDIQYKIINRIAKKYGNICVVGDENQSIYGFRGANIKNILDFEKDYPDALVIKLEENYRSTSIILDAANAVIKHNTTSRDKKLWTKKDEGDKIILAHCKDGREEAEMAVNAIREMRSSGKSLKDFTILYRTNAQSRNFEEAFLKNNIPYKIFGGMQFYQRAEIKDILAYLTFINNPKDALSFARIINVPKRKIGEKTLEKIVEYGKMNSITTFEALAHVEEIEGIGPAVKVTLKEFHFLISELIDMARDYGKVSEIFDKLLVETQYESYIKTNYPDSEGRLENIDELKNSITELEKMAENMTLGEYLENVSLVSATDELEENIDYVKLMTIHNSKGLEFPVVFLTGVEDEIFPGRAADFEPATLEEERRLCYVAITRAEEKLVISFADSRFMYGDMNFRTRSRFIKEIPAELLEERVGAYLSEKREYVQSIYANKSEETSRKNLSNFSLDSFREKMSGKSDKNYPYKSGEKVMHKKFGLGIVRDMDDKKVVVEFVDGKKDIAAVIADKFLEKLS